MRRTAVLTIVLLLLPQVFAQPMKAVPAEIAAERGVAIPVEIKVRGVMDIKNTSIIYEHQFSNPYNETLKFALRYWFTREPGVLEVYVNGEKAELETVSEDDYRSEYRLPLSIEKNGSIIVISRMNYSTMPERYRLGLWGNYYSFSPPINIESVGRVPGYLYGSIKGEIKIPSNIKKVSCRECKYDKDNLITINLKERTYPSFSFNFQTKRTPVKAGIFYILMLAVIFGFVIRGRRKI